MARPSLSRSTPLLLALSLFSAGCPSDDEGCPSGQTECNGVCRDAAFFQSDPTNCGACGIACGLGTCAGGVCQCEGATSCPGQNPRCADTQSDANNCGTCGNVCTKPGSGCALGACACVAPADDDCGTFCTDTLTDAANCGLDQSSCGSDCPLANDVCNAGACECPASLPTVCGTACVDTLTDPQNCGPASPASCGIVCPLANDVCVGGGCACPASLPDRCPVGTPTRCVSLASDEQNCGTCGVRCATGATCAGSPPRCECPTGETDCDGACADTSTDERNCGGCRTVCPAGSTCTSGQCSCTGSTPQRCGSTCCAGNECCGGGTSCPLAHSNGLGGTYLDCGALDQHTADQARRAAVSWNPNGITIESGLLCGSCLCRQTTTQAAVWCYEGSGVLKGFVAVVNSPNCSAACPFPGNGPVAWH